MTFPRECSLFFLLIIEHPFVYTRIGSPVRFVRTSGHVLGIAQEHRRPVCRITFLIGRIQFVNGAFEGAFLIAIVNIVKCQVIVLFSSCNMREI